jgi:hypothetical protein
MREKPDLQDVDIYDCLFNQYGLKAAEVTFLPGGGDISSYLPGNHMGCRRDGL